MHFNSASSLKQQPGPRVEMSLPLDTHNPDTDPKSLCYYHSLFLRDYLRSSKCQCCCLWFDLSVNPTEHANNLSGNPTEHANNLSGNPTEHANNLNFHTQTRPLIINIMKFSRDVKPFNYILCYRKTHLT